MSLHARDRVAEFARARHRNHGREHDFKLKIFIVFYSVGGKEVTPSIGYDSILGIVKDEFELNYLFCTVKQRRDIGKNHLFVCVITLTFASKLSVKDVCVSVV